MNRSQRKEIHSLAKTTALSSSLEEYHVNITVLDHYFVMNKIQEILQDKATITIENKDKIAENKKHVKHAILLAIFGLENDAMRKNKTQQKNVTSVEDSSYISFIILSSMIRNGIIHIYSSISFSGNKDENQNNAKLLYDICLLIYKFRDGYEDIQKLLQIMVNIVGIGDYISALLHGVLFIHWDWFDQYSPSFETWYLEVVKDEILQIYCISCFVIVFSGLGNKNEKIDHEDNTIEKSRELLRRSFTKDQLDDITNNYSRIKEFKGGKNNLTTVKNENSTSVEYEWNWNFLPETVATTTTSSTATTTTSTATTFLCEPMDTIFKLQQCLNFWQQALIQETSTLDKWNSKRNSSQYQHILSIEEEKWLILTGNIVLSIFHEVLLN
jgi:hypothetical protein